MELDQFTNDLNDLAVSFDHNLKGAKIAQWYNDFKFLTAYQFRQICGAAKRELEKFPSAKFFFGEIIARGWRERHEVRHDSWIVVECPKCDGSFAVTLAQINQAKERAEKFVCVNNKHWGCPITFSPATLLAKTAKLGDTIRKKDWEPS